jgi:hypothetical protein
MKREYSVECSVNDTERQIRASALSLLTISQAYQAISAHRNPEKKVLRQGPRTTTDYFAFIRHTDLCNRTKPWVRYYVLATLTG